LCYIILAVNYKNYKIQINAPARVFLIQRLRERCQIWQFV